MPDAGGADSASTDDLIQAGPRSRGNRRRIGAMLVVGVVVTVVVGLLVDWRWAGTAGWAAACLTYVSATWIRIGRLDGLGTARLATREDDSRPVSDLLLIAAAIGSIVALVIVLAGATTEKGAEQTAVAALALVSLALSWLLVQTLFTLRYAELYYTGEDGGVGFNQDTRPTFTDFAYLAFTVGMTYQVSDTDISASKIRATILRHALLSYLFGAVIIAAAVNLVAGLSSGS